MPPLTNNIFVHVDQIWASFVCESFFMQTLQLPLQQVEYKMIDGFNQALKSKAFMQNG